MGADALRGNGITTKLLYLMRDKTLNSPRDPLHKQRLRLPKPLLLSAFQS
ncbi:hypothetical protein AZE42_14133 [Rhizopogon vesiculosus]|uniref:Uncharacterized protein n=1 Tax=Rhizopogon vesiculosus TaxID=180088 RepID=A0A1J8Q515_9AGAM|nr:hypothetical protein AZE42_14133 [Rhizopogon vesiculosus]